jgi:hypothetical protein
MAKLSRARVSITGALLGLLLAVGTTGQGAWAESELPAPEITEPAAPSPDPIEPPVAVQPTTDVPAPEPAPDEPPAVVTQPAPPEQEPNVVRSPTRSSTGGATRRTTPLPPSPSTTPTPVEVAAPVAPSPAPTPTRSPKPEPATLWNVDYTSSTGSGPPALAVVALSGSLGLVVLLGVGYLVYQTRMANRLPKNPFSRR